MSPLERLRTLLAEMSPLPAEDIPTDADLVQTLGLSSLELTVLMSNVEQEFGIQLSRERLDPVRTVADLLEVIVTSPGMTAA